MRSLLAAGVAALAVCAMQPALAVSMMDEGCDQELAYRFMDAMNADHTIKASGILIINVLHITQVRRSPNEIICHCVLLSNSGHTWPGTINIWITPSGEILQQFVLDQSTSRRAR
jgi:hypothetical protein